MGSRAGPIRRPHRADHPLLRRLLRTPRRAARARPLRRGGAERRERRGRRI